MKTGKLPEHTLKRSVLNPIRYRSSDVGFRGAVGHDGAVIGNMVTAIAATAFSYTGNELYALHNAINNVIAAGGRPYGASVAILMPEHSDEATLRGIMDRLTRQAEELHMDLFAGHTELIPTVNAPTVTITTYGEKIWENQHNKVIPEMDIIMTKSVGLYGGSLLAQVKEKELRTRYPASYINVAAKYMEQISLFPEQRAMEAAVAEHPGCIFAAHDVSNGGLFGALWQLLSACDCGGEIDFRSIPIKQEIIEVCEFFDINPYMMNGQGSLLLISDAGELLVEKIREQGIEANIIGKTTSSKDRKVMIGEEERFLVPPKGDALNVVFYGQKMQI